VTSCVWMDSGQRPCVHRSPAGQHQGSLMPRIWVPARVRRMGLFALCGATLGTGRLAMWSVSSGSGPPQGANPWVATRPPSLRMHLISVIALA